MSKLVKALILVNILAWGSVGYQLAQAEEVKKEKACVEVKDAKTGKVTQQCKEIKKHKKLAVEK